MAEESSLKDIIAALEATRAEDAAIDHAEPHQCHCNGITLKIPPFKGSSDPEEYLEWIARMENLFDCSRLTDARKCLLAATGFTGYATIWWERVKRMRSKLGEGPIQSWTAMQSLMHQRFIPRSYEQDLCIKLHTLRQGTQSVADYVREFETLQLRLDEIFEPKEQSISRFIAGLRFEIGDEVDLHCYTCLDDAIEYAIRVENVLKRRSSYASNG